MFRSSLAYLQGCDKVYVTHCRAGCLTNELYNAIYFDQKQIHICRGNGRKMRDFGKERKYSWIWTTTICCITHCAIPHVHAIYRKEGVKSHNSDNSSRCPCFMAWASCERICNFTESKLLHTCKNSIYNIQSRSVTYQTLGQCDKPINCRSKDWELLKLQYNTKTEQKSLQMFLKSLLVVRCWTQMTQF